MGRDVRTVKAGGGTTPATFHIPDGRPTLYLISDELSGRFGRGMNHFLVDNGPADVLGIESHNSI